MAIDDPTWQVKSLRAQLQALARLTAAMISEVELNVRPVFQAALVEACQALEADMGALHLGDEEHRLTRLVASHQLDSLWARAWQSLELDGSAPPALAQRQGRVLEVVGGDAPPGLGGVICAPVRGAELCVGAISLLWLRKPPPHPDRASFLITLGHLVGLAIEHAGLVAEMVENLEQVLQLKNKVERRNRELDDLNRQLSQANQSLEQLSVTDGLTGLYNHRHLHQRLAEEVRRSRRQGQPICLLMADLDHFKRVNDQLGHQAGDEALRLVADWLRKSVREVDTVGRYGGEEFVVVLSDCDLANGLKVAEKLRSLVETNSRRPPFDALGGLTISLGAAQLEPGMTPEELINAADRALYRAKQGGRNQVQAAAPA
ncbi:MAG: sensor domain-containing diguanylate cyclase [Desulfarculus sp.]|nr:sensor domain-containing diguanylate cyclase [Desulfarculus sp.]